MAGGIILSNLQLRSVNLPKNWPYEAEGLALGLGNSPLEILVASAPTEPNTTTLRSAWKARHGRRPAPLLLVVLYGEKAAICGPVGDDAPAYLGVDRGQAERICRALQRQNPMSKRCRNT